MGTACCIASQPAGSPGWGAELGKQRTWNTPLEISCDAARLQALIQPRVSDGNAVRTPTLLGRVKPFLDFALQDVQTEVEVLGLALFGGGAVELALGVNQPASRIGLLISRGVLLRLDGIEQVATGVALRK